MSKETRIVKEHDERRNEIIETASRLFAQKGYDKCSVNDILTAIGIAKGTFYHYFKSKEEVLDAVVGQATELIRDRVSEVVKREDLAPDEMILQIFLSMRIEKEMTDGILDEIHKSENALFHQKSLVQTVDMIAPVLTKVVEKGIEKGIFVCAFPKEYMRIFMASTLTLTDQGIFHVAPEEEQMQIVSLISLLEMMLGQEPGSVVKKVQEYYK